MRRAREFPLDSNSFSRKGRWERKLRRGGLVYELTQVGHSASKALLLLLLRPHTFGML
jgi:hypothetical protein